MFLAVNIRKSCCVWGKNVCGNRLSLMEFSVQDVVSTRTQEDNTGSPPMGMGDVEWDFYISLLLVRGSH